MSINGHTKNASVRQTIDTMLQSIGGHSKQAEANTEAGGYHGGTSHPVKDVDDRTQSGQEGARSSENERDVKEDQGSPGVNSTTPGTPGGQDSVMPNIGTHQAATGEDPSVETDSAKGGKEDGEYQGSSSHPARTDNDSLDGHKYSSARRLLELTKKASSKGEELISHIAVEADEQTQKRAAEYQQRQKAADDGGDGGDDGGDDGGGGEEGSAGDGESATATAEEPAASEEDKQASQRAYAAGEQLANTLLEGPINWQDKEAVDAVVVDSLAMTIMEAEKLAEDTAAYIKEVSERKKRAEHGEEDGEDKETPPKKEEGEEGSESSEGGETSGGGESAAPSSPASPEPAAGGDEYLDNAGVENDEDALMAALSGGEEMGAGEAMSDMAGGGGGEMPPGPEMGGMPPGAEAGGMPPGPEMAGGEGGAMPPGPEAGGMPPGPEMGGGMPPGPEMGGGGEIPPELQMLAAALMEAGITPEQLAAASSAKTASELCKISSDSKQVPKVDWSPKTAEERKRYNATLEYVKELVQPATSA